MSRCSTYESIAKRFWSNVKIKRKEDCWVWIGKLSKDGYGRFGISGGGWVGLMGFRPSWVRSHRMAWVLKSGKAIPKGLCVCHECDNPKCCNPDHLWLGTNQQNTKDRELKKRGVRGERVGNSLLTKKAVRAIRRRYASGFYTQQDLHAFLKSHFGITTKKSLIGMVLRGKSWQHVGGPIVLDDTVWRQNLLKRPKREKGLRGRFV